MQIRREIRSIWNLMAADVDVMKWDDLATLFSAVERETSGDVRLFLEPWWSLFAVAIAWLSNLYLACDEANARSPAEQARVMLVGTTTAYTVAVRRLILSGLDAPARAVLRSLAELIYITVALLADDTLAKEYQREKTWEEERRFWRRNLTGGALEQRLANFEASRGVDETLRAELAQTRTHLNRWLSQFVHPSYVAGFLASLPRSARDPTQAAMGVFGHCSIGSYHTLKHATELLWYFGAVGFFMPDGSLPLCYFPMNPSSKHSRVALVACQTFLSCVAEHLGDETPKTFEFPAG